MYGLFRTARLIDERIDPHERYRAYSWLQATLAGDGIEAVIFDQYASAVEGQVGPVQRRVMVLDEDFDRAQWILNHERPQPA